MSMIWLIGPGVAARAEAVIRERFLVYVSMPAHKVETMRPPADVAAAILGAARAPIDRARDGVRMTIRAVRRLARNRRWMVCAALLALLGTAHGAGAHMEPVKAPATVTVDTLKRFLAAFNAHDLDAIMQFFADDCELYMPRGEGPAGTRYVGKAAVREGLATRFASTPDVHYGDDDHWVAGNHGVSTWLLTGTTRAGEQVRVRGVDLLEFREGKITRKDSYWKIVEKR